MEQISVDRQESEDSQEEVEHKEEELIDHFIELDRYVQVTLRIPKNLNALELKGITDKAQKLYKIAEIPLEAVPQAPREPRKYKKAKSRFNGSGSNYKKQMWFPQMVSELYRMKDVRKLSLDDIQENINRKFETDFTKEQVRQKISNLKNHKKWGNHLMIE